MLKLQHEKAEVLQKVCHKICYRYFYNISLGFHGFVLTVICRKSLQVG